ncbi:beta-ketoacyl-[acyl-carrier-protein] synthase family protein [Cellvibrio mixtus]|uniref:beta-ketoacyl-[acyl-carrier-protein] synthase family protein n=1 Tax=Cellvibrio mixtus TaxID=39650 RepID=UPI0005873F3C|nr:beta-ketoacyl-[acyl-carrier-protein] synthase family protein [Cellvibrio mixtus]
MSQRVVVTGLGVVGRLGFHWRDFWKALLAGESAVVPWQPGAISDFPVRYAAPVDDAAFTAAFAGLVESLPPMERRSRFGAMAAYAAMHDAGLIDKDLRLGVAVGSGIPERDTADMLLAMTDAGPSWDAFYARRAQLNPALRGGNDQLAAVIARQFKARGPVQNFSTACAGAAHAIGSSFRMIRNGEINCMIAGGADSVLSPMTITGLHLLGAPSVNEDLGDKLCRPFDEARSGFIAAEGGAFVVLESLDHARTRNATIYGEVLGFGSSMDAYRVTAPHPEGRGAAQSMENALRDAGIAPGDIDYINAHGTSTPLNDPAETMAIKHVFAAGDHYRKLAVSATKSQIGHWIAAAGAPEFIATLLAARDGIAPPTLNLENPDPACDLDYVPLQARPMKIGAALSNSFGFGGLNASLIVKPYIKEDAHEYHG